MTVPRRLAYAPYIDSTAAKGRTERCFRVDLTEWSALSVGAEEVIEGAFISAYVHVLRPLLAVSGRCRIYDATVLTYPTALAVYERVRTTTPSAQRRRWLNEYTRRVRGAPEVRLDLEGVLDDTAFWWWLIGSGAHPIIVVDARYVTAATLFRETHDPRVEVLPTSGGISAAGVGYARRETETGQNVAFIVDRSVLTPYTIGLVVTAAEEVIVALFEEAMEQSQLSDAFRERHERM